MKWNEMPKLVNWPFVTRHKNPAPVQLLPIERQFTHLLPRPTSTSIYWLEISFRKNKKIDWERENLLFEKTALPPPARAHFKVESQQRAPLVHFLQEEIKNKRGLGEKKKYIGGLMSYFIRFFTFRSIKWEHAEPESRLLSTVERFDGMRLLLLFLFSHLFPNSSQIVK